MQLWHAAVLGIIEGFTEFLPISSTGHMIVASRLIGVPQTEVLKTFEIAVQLGAILAVIVLFWKKLFFDFEIFKRVAAAFIPTGILGLLLYKVVKHYLLGEVTVVLWALFIGGLVLILFEYFHREPAGPPKDPITTTAELRKMSYGQAAGVGAAQALAMIPGVSRSAATIVAGLGMGISRPVIVEFSFLLAIPTMLAATGLDLVKNADSFSSGDVAALALGTVIAFGVALLSVRWLLRYVRTNTFSAFGVYRVIAAAAFWFLLK